MSLHQRRGLPLLQELDVNEPHSNKRKTRPPAHFRLEGAEASSPHSMASSDSEIEPPSNKRRRMPPAPFSFVDTTTSSPESDASSAALTAPNMNESPSDKGRRQCNQLPSADLEAISPESEDCSAKRNRVAIANLRESLRASNRATFQELRNGNEPNGKDEDEDNNIKDVGKTHKQIKKGVSIPGPRSNLYLLPCSCWQLARYVDGQ